MIIIGPKGHYVVTKSEYFITRHLNRFQTSNSNAAHEALRVRKPENFPFCPLFDSSKEGRILLHVPTVRRYFVSNDVHDRENDLDHETERIV